MQNDSRQQSVKAARQPPGGKEITNILLDNWLKNEMHNKNCKKQVKRSKPHDNQIGRTQSNFRERRKGKESVVRKAFETDWQ